MTPAGRRFLFVCTGNTCRSPMAEGIAHRLQAEGIGAGLEFASAGTAAADGGAASPLAMAVAWSHRIDLGHHRSRRFTPGLADWADVIVCMTPAHARTVEQIAPGSRVLLVTDWLPAEASWRGRAVPDPFGGDASEYEETYHVLRGAIDAFLSGLSGSPVGEEEA